MTVIDSYLDTLFAPYPSSPRMLEARAELRALMEDQLQGLKEEGLSESQALGRVIADFGSLDEVAGELGIERELGRSGRGGAAADTGRDDELDARPPVLELDRIDQYLERVRGTQWMTAVAIPLFVLCPIPLLGLLAASGAIAPEPAAWRVIVGLVLLLVLVCLGMLLLMLRGSRLADFEDIEEQRFTLTRQVRARAEELRRESRRRTVVAVAGAIALWILCAIPVIITGLLADGDQTSTLPLLGVCLTLVMVALGLFIMLRAGWADHVADTLLHEQEKQHESLEHSPSPAIRIIAAIYWPFFAAVYLIWSFTTGEWGTTWLVWPVAGVLYAALWGVSAALGQDKEQGSRR
ncbi:permease prefix domain 1-containing protein [Brachybacterium sp. DNPG3]